jgi:cytochrome c1
MITRVAAIALCALVAGGVAKAAEAPPAPSQDWSFDGIFGTFDRPSAQRGFQVYKEVCATCHALSLVDFRNLQGIGFNEDAIKAIAAEYEIEDGPNDEGDMFFRPGLPADGLPSPFPNEQAARFANNGAYPPDLSLITKARKDGPNYLYALLTGYQDEVPLEFLEEYKKKHDGAEFVLMDGMYFNAYFGGHQIAMAQPLYEDSVEYADGTPATIPQMSEDLVTFLHFAAEPMLEERKRMGISAMLFMFVFTGLLYALKRKIWSDVH